MCRAVHHVLYKVYRWHRMYSTHTHAGGILATFWPYLSEPLTDTVCSHTLYGCIWAAYSEYGVRTLLFHLIGYFLLLTLQEPIQNPWNGVILSIQDFPSNNSIAIILQEFYKPLLLSILVHFSLSNFWRRCLAAFVHKYSIPIFWPTWILAMTYSSNPTQNFSTGQQVHATLSWAMCVWHSTFCSPTLAAPGLWVNFYMSLKSQLYGPLHLSKLFFLQPKEDFDQLNANLSDFHPSYVPHCHKNASVS